jgi:hypothetical protein
MPKQTRILVVDSDLHALSKIYLALVHRNYKTEASDKPEELAERTHRLKPAVLVLSETIFLNMDEKRKVPAVILSQAGSPHRPVPDDCRRLVQPVSIEVLVRTIEELVI